MVTTSSIWDDGRSGRIGKFAGNMALRAVGGNETNLGKEKGTIFASDESIFVGRVSTEGYLTGSTVHWANVSWDQHSALTQQARTEKKHLQYLFITAAAPAEIRIWLVPASVVETSIRQRGKDRPGEVLAVHIVAEGDRYLLGDEDVTSFFTRARLNPSEQQQLKRLIDEAASEREASPPDESVPPDHAMPPNTRSPIDRSPIDRSTEFVIPVAGGRAAHLNVQLPLAPGDVSRIKGWIDLMSDVLVEDPHAATEEAKRAQRTWLRDQLQAGLRQLDNGEGVEGEAAFARILDRSNAIAAGQK